MKRRGRNDSGEAVTETVLIVPVLLLMILLIIQFGLWYHAQHVVQAAAQEGSRAGRGQGATADDGERRAEQFLDVSGASLIEGPTVTSSRSTEVITVEVSGHVVAVIPGLRLPVHATAASPTEEFRSSDETTP